MGRSGETFAGARVLRAAGWVVGFVAVCFFLLFVMGKVLYFRAFGISREYGLFMLVLLMASVGYLMCIFWDRAGAWMQIAGGMAAILLLIVINWPHYAAMFSASVNYGLPFIGSGILFLLGRPRRPAPGGLPGR